jgi:hypothetical protein
VHSYDSKRLLAEYEKWVRCFKSWREQYGKHVVPTSVILVFLSWRGSLLSDVDPFLSSSIWKVKQRVSYCMQEIGVTLISIFLYNAIFVADSINDCIKTRLVERKIGRHWITTKDVGRLTLDAWFQHFLKFLFLWILNWEKYKGENMATEILRKTTEPLSITPGCRGKNLETYPRALFLNVIFHSLMSVLERNGVQVKTFLRRT